ncbi:bacillithiol biosynthesis cysteine-adding enzyme BshC [Fredinandcohnia sp. 179-A 10B2 NHS]|uniref:bacillithiol biosynthesis cysteine-adding enzyme BshC n=1 Tax=Fredinandcohnia sp. 179-A 10B2 NHS TaxID=3235176 RepID=UPI0039A2A19E
MEVVDLFLPSSNRLVNDYISNKMDTSSFFDYDIHSPIVYEVRKNDLAKRLFDREKLVNQLLSFNKRFNYHQNTIDNIHKLEDPASVVVIGGQQAGVLTGPLYSIHKIISIIKLAKEQEEKLQIPVIPVFWIAGEDHDFAEINHVYINDPNKGISKKAVPQRHIGKSMVSSINLEKEHLSAWVESIFETFGETNYTNELLHRLTTYIENSQTYVDFFIQIINDLFGETGLVLVDSGSSQIRNLEQTNFKTLIEKNKEIHDALISQQEKISKCQYPKTIDMNENSANIFYHLNGERVLLEYNKEHDVFSGKNNECILCTEEILQIAAENPEQLSNNVVTRPVMQELLFPTLAFISGPGEISYWAELKQVFSVMGIKMPPVVPRLMITLLERPIESTIGDLGLTIEGALTGELAKVKSNWLNNHTGDVEHLIADAKKEVEQIHKKIRMAALNIDQGLSELLVKNADLIQSQFDFLQMTINRRFLHKNEVEIKKYDRIETSLIPLGAPQERIWNIFYYLNKYGTNFVVDLLNLEYKFNWNHKVIKL